MKIYITRHGQVCPHKFEKSVDFPTGDIPLSETGCQQAVCLGKKMKKRGFTGKIISSPYRRTMMTANLVAKECGAQIYPDGALREMFFSNEAAKKFEGMPVHILKEEFNFVVPDAQLPYPWWTTHTDSLEEVAMRLKGFWEDLLRKDFEEVLAICHGASVFGSVNYFNKKFGLGFPAELPALGEFLATRNLNCNISCIELDGERNFVSAHMFDIGHLKDSLLTSNTNPRPRPDVYTRFS